MKIVNRIKANEDFALTIKKGKVQRHPSYTIHYCQNDLSYTRVGISVSVKLGNAVKRNHIKRQIRNMCDLLIDYNSQAFDLVVIAKPNFLNCSFAENLKTLGELLNFR